MRHNLIYYAFAFAVTQCIYWVSWIVRLFKMLEFYCVILIYSFIYIFVYLFVDCIASVYCLYIIFSAVTLVSVIARFWMIIENGPAALLRVTCVQCAWSDSLANADVVTWAFCLGWHILRFLCVDDGSSSACWLDFTYWILNICSCFIARYLARISEVLRYRFTLPLLLVYY